MQKIGAISSLSRNNVLSNRAFWATLTPSIEHGLVLDILETTLNFVGRRACPCLASMLDLNYFRHTVCKLCYVRPFISHFSPRKLQKIQELSKTQTTWHGTLNCLYKFMEKIIYEKSILNHNLKHLFKTVILVFQTIFQFF